MRICLSEDALTALGKCDRIRKALLQGIGPDARTRRLIEESRSYAVEFVTEVLRENPKLRGVFDGSDL